MMNRQNNVRAVVMACALAMGTLSTHAGAQTTYFDFSTVSPSVIDSIPLDNGPNAVTVGLSTGGSATFSDPNSSGNFYFSSAAAGLHSALASPVILTETGSSGDTLDVTFSQPVTSLGFLFSLGNYAAGDALQVTLLNGSTVVKGIGTATNVAFAGDSQAAYGTFGYTGAPVTSLIITATTSAANAAALNFASINISPVPEPSVWALTLAGLLVVAGVARRRQGNEASGAA